MTHLGTEAALLRHHSMPVRMAILRVMALVPLTAPQSFEAQCSAVKLCCPSAAQTGQGKASFREL